MNGSVHNGESSLGDRGCARFVVPGATVCCRWTRFWRLGKTPSSGERFPVVDISTTGMSFLTDNPPRSSRVMLLLNYSEHDGAIHLKGRVVYVVPRGGGLSYHYRVGVTFNPFSPRKADNSLEALSMLKKLERTYGLEATLHPPPESARI